MILSDSIRQSIVRHARQSLPNEAVGLLAGPANGSVELVLPLPNIAGGSRRFLADPFAQFAALKQIRAAGFELLAIYHSHPGGGVDPSAHDLEYAAAWPCAHLIVALDVDADKPERLRAYQYLSTGVISNVPLSAG